MAKRSGQTWETLNAELEALRERVAELEAAAAEREERIEAVDWRAFESRAALMALSTLEEGRFIEVNEVYLETLGFRREEVIGKTSIELGIFVEPGDRDALKKAVVEKGFARNIPVTVRTKGGELRHGLFSADIVRRKDQVCWFTVVVDTTAKKKVEEALFETEAKWRSILENLPGVIVAAEPDGTITFLNRTFSGITPERVIGTSVFDHVQPQSQGTVQDAFERVLEGGETVTYELVADLPGASIPVENRVGPLERDGRIVGVTIVSSDITKRKHAEEERYKLETRMRNTQRLESLGVLAGGIAHDFNNLLVAILGNADLALMDMAPHAPYREWIEQIKLAGKQASELTNQMLIYSGRATHVAAPLDLNELVTEMANLLRASISKKAVLNCEYGEEVLLVDADASQMRQVVMNLIINASEAIGDAHGTVTIRTGEIGVDEGIDLQFFVGEDLPKGRCFSLEVADTGCGIEVANRSKLFDPFYSTKFAGRGLGLAAVLGIVRAHRGAIEVRSQVNQGSTFRILLPAVESSAAARSDHDGPQGQDFPAGGTILVVDDEEGVRNVAKGMLEREGFRVITAEDGLEAVRVFRNVSEEIDAVLLDLSMPHLDGGEVLREMRRIRSDVKAILCSGYMEVRAKELSIGAGQISFLRKPFDSEALLGTLREVLASEGGRDSGDRRTDG